MLQTEVKRVQKIYSPLSLHWMARQVKRSMPPLIAGTRRSSQTGLIVYDNASNDFLPFI